MGQNNSSLKILVVDDQQADRELVKDILFDLGYFVETADSGRAAIENLKCHYYDIVLTDLMMPEIDGISLTNFVKTNFSDIEVIIMTAYATVESAISAIKFGAYDYIIKPVNRTKLSVTIKNCLEKRNLQRETKILQEKLRQVEKLTAVSRFITSVTHHIRNPLFTITSSSELLKEKILSINNSSEVTKEIYQLLDVIISGCKTIDNYIRELLTSTKVDSGMLSQINVTKNIVRVIETLRPVFEQRKIELKVSLDNEAVIIAEENAFQQCIMNILVNSVEAIHHENGIIRISVYKKQNKVEIEIEDNGVGIEQKDVSKIFEPFYTTKTKGTGFGLFYVYNTIVNCFGGDIYVSSPGKDKGTKFILSFTAF